MSHYSTPAEFIHSGNNIIELNQKIAKIAAQQNKLRVAIDEIIADIEGAK